MLSSTRRVAPAVVLVERQEDEEDARQDETAGGQGVGHVTEHPRRIVRPEPPRATPPDGGRWPSQDGRLALPDVSGKRLGAWTEESDAATPTQHQMNTSAKNL